jgi:hypothetical protein
MTTPECQSRGTNGGLDQVGHGVKNVLYVFLKRGATMRLNGFNEPYCHTADEARKLIEKHGAPVYVPNLDPGWGTDPATAEIADHVTGDLVCYIEAPTVETVKAILSELNLQVQ